MAEAENRIFVEVSPGHAYSRWDRIEDLPLFLEGVRSVTNHGSSRTHWVAEIDGRVEEWDADVVRVPGERIAFRDAEGRHVLDARFAPGDEGDGGTLVTLRVVYRPAGLRITAEALGVAARLVADDLRRFKVLVEDGPAALEREIHDGVPLEGDRDDYHATARPRDLDRLPGEPRPARRPDYETDPADFDDNAARFSREVPSDARAPG